MRKSGLVPLVGILAITFGLLIPSIILGNSPLLGLDLQGGVEVVLRPTEGQDVSTEDLDLSAEIIRRRVDSLGVAEPDVTRQGNNLVVQLPGIDNQERAVELVGQTGKLEFRPLLSSSFLSCTERLLHTSGWIFPHLDVGSLAAGVDLETITQINNQINDAVQEYELAVSRGEIVQEIPACIGVEPPDLGPEPEITTTTTTSTTTTTTTTATTTSTTDTTQATDESETTTEDGETETEEAPVEEPPAIEPPAIEPLSPEYDNYVLNRGGLVTNPATAEPGDYVIYVGANPINAQPEFQKSILGPALLDGSALKGASAIFSGIATWSILLDFRSGEEGIDLFNNAASICAGRQPECPLTQLAITLDGFIESSPAVQQAFFDPDNIAIQGDFTESEARDLARILRYGALPLEFDDPVEAGLVRSVSATLGRDSLRAGMIAGIIGIAIVTLYMVIYYRLLGLMAFLSLLISGLLLWTTISFLSETQGLALTLAGITGLIVAVGVSIDSNVVYFENLKEDLFNGKTLRSSTTQAFPVAFKTIFWANLATLIGAGILWWLTIGSVRGFAATLAIASVLDLVATYFFLRPAAKLLAHSKLIKNNPKWFIGIKDNAPV